MNEDIRTDEQRAADVAADILANLGELYHELGDLAEQFEYLAARTSSRAHAAASRAGTAMDSPYTSTPRSSHRRHSANAGSPTFEATSTRTSSAAIAPR